jgi:hypothetical protein
MRTFTFTPTKEETQVSEIEIPYFENARSDFAPYYGAGKDSQDRVKRLREAKDEVINELAKLGAGDVSFAEGYFGDKPKRYGYVIRFLLTGNEGRINVAGLPMKNRETPIKLLDVKIQALLNVRDWLKSAITGEIFSPGSKVLIQFLLVDGKHTIAEYLMAQGHLPQLEAPDQLNVVDGVFVDEGYK